HRFELFKALSLLYFAAASYSETARRLGKEHLADGFLLCQHPLFSRRLRQICQLAVTGCSTILENDFKELVNEAIAPFDVAGLTDPARHPWYPARPEDLLDSAAKLGASQDEVGLMLKKCGIGAGRDRSEQPLFLT